MWNFVRFLLGLAVGSFVGVVASRYDPDRFVFSRLVIGGRSRCTECRATLRWFELLPLVSFALQGGRCRRCGARLSLYYPLVELASGFIFLLVPYGFGAYNGIIEYIPLPLVSIWISVFTILLLISLIDARLEIIPDELNIALAALGLLAACFARTQFSQTTGSFVGHYAALAGLRDYGVWVNLFSAALIAFLIFAFLIFITRGRGMGAGDLKLAAALGFVFGWPDILLVIALGFIVGSVFGGIAMLARGKTLKSFVPFGPFLALGAALTFFFGYNMVHWYFTLFRL